MAVPLSKSELDFAIQALRVENVRVDGRALTAYRRLGIRFGAVYGEVEVNFGPTKALAVCSGEIVAPSANRPREGRISFHVEFGPLASPSFEVGRPSPQAISVGNFVERLLRGSRAIDAEALCIVSGQKVWSIRVDVRALDDDGNLSDVCAIAALCALLHFRKADVEVKGDSAQSFATEERAPVPLSVHHLPVPVTFALFASGTDGKDAERAWVLDPNRLEEAAMGGSLCIAVNQHGELCGVHKPGGLPVDFALTQHCMDLAVTKAKEITTRINTELEADMAKRQQAKKNVHEQFNQESLLTVEWDSAPTQEASVPVAPAPLPARPVRPDVQPASSPPQMTQAPEPLATPTPPAPPPAQAPAAQPPTQLAPAETVEDQEEPKTKKRLKSAQTHDAAGNFQEEPKTRKKVKRPQPKAAAAGSREEAPPVSVAVAVPREVSANLDALEDDGRDLDAELQAVAEEAAELEAQLEAAVQSEMAALEAEASLEARASQDETGGAVAKKKRKKKIRSSI